jgi:hypothetical protein
LKSSLLILSICLSGCAWFHSKPVAPVPPRVVVTGVAAGSLLFVDGVQSGEAQEAGNRTRVLEVAPGTHMVEVKMGDRIVYRESTTVAPGQKSVITVLSGNSLY